MALVSALVVLAASDLRADAPLQSHAAAPMSSRTPASVAIVDGSQSWDPPSFAFEGTFAGTFAVTPLEGASSAQNEEPEAGAVDEPSSTPSRPRFQILVQLSDGRTFRKAFTIHGDHEEARPYGIRPLFGRQDAFVVEVSSHSGEDCVEESIHAYVLHATTTGLELLAHGFVGHERRAFDACADFLEPTYVDEGGAIRVTRRVQRIAGEETMDAEQRDALRAMNEEVRAVRAEAKARRREAVRSHASPEELGRLDDALDEALAEVRARFAFQIGRPWMLCRFPRMLGRCGPERVIEDSFQLGERPTFR